MFFTFYLLYICYDLYVWFFYIYVDFVWYIFVCMFFVYIHVVQLSAFNPASHFSTK